MNQFMALSPGRRITVAACLLLFVDSFLPWYHISVAVFGFHASDNADGWHQMGATAFVFALLAVAAEVVRVLGVVSWSERNQALTSFALAAATALFVLIFVIQRLSDGYLGFGAWIGIVLLVALVFGLYRTALELRAAGAWPTSQQPGE